jgi:putative nucleotidyltransferase with HDIG domain
MHSDSDLSEHTAVKWGSVNKVRFPIRVKITLPYLILALALALSASYIVTRLIFDTIGERFDNHLVESGNMAAEWLVREEDRLLSGLRLLANLENLAEAIGVRDSERIRTLTFGLVFEQRLELVELYSPEGELLLGMRHQIGGEAEDFIFFRREGEALHLPEFVEIVFERRQDNQGDKYAGLIFTGNFAYMSVAGPIIDESNNFAGVIVVGKALHSIVSDMRRDIFAHVSFYDNEGRPSQSTFFQPAPLPVGTVSEIINLHNQVSLKRNLQPSREIEIGNIEYVEILSPWQVRGSESLGLIGVSLTKTFFVNPSNLTRAQLMLLVTVAFTLVIILGINVANLVTAPILNLVEASKKVAQGNLNVYVEPDTNDELAVLIHSFNHMVTRLKIANDELIHAYDKTLEGWSKALDLRDEDTEGHSERVTTLTLSLAEEMGMCSEDIVHLRRGALLHDIGKMGIPDSILLKSSGLSEDEWQVMYRHPLFAYQMLSPIEYLQPALDIPYCHHERWDGRGYPRGLKGTEIPLAARIFAVVDVWDAITTDRPYRLAFSREDALEHIKNESGKYFDPQVVEAFIKLISQNTEPVSELQEAGS